MDSLSVGDSEHALLAVTGFYRPIVCLDPLSLDQVCAMRTMTEEYYRVVSGFPKRSWIALAQKAMPYVLEIWDLAIRPFDLTRAPSSLGCVQHSSPSQIAGLDSCSLPSGTDVIVSAGCEAYLTVVPHRREFSQIMPEVRFPNPPFATKVAKCSPHSREVLLGGGEGDLGHRHSIRRYSMETGQLLELYSAHETYVFGIAFDPTSRSDVVYSSSWSPNPCVKVWSRGYADCVRTIPLENPSSSLVCYDNLLLAGCADGFVEVWDVRRTSETLQLLEIHPGIGALNCIMKMNAEDPENHLFVSGSSDSSVIVWDQRTGKQKATFDAPGEVWGICWIDFDVETTNGRGMMRFENRRKKGRSSPQVPKVQPRRVQPRKVQPKKDDSLAHFQELMESEKKEAASNRTNRRPKKKRRRNRKNRRRRKNRANANRNRNMSSSVTWSEKPPQYDGIAEPPLSVSSLPEKGKFEVEGIPEQLKAAEGAESTEADIQPDDLAEPVAAQEIEEAGEDIARSDSSEEVLERFQCVVCMTSPKTTVFLPCKHMVCCKKCADQLELCPMCRVPIEDRMSVYGLY